jgi:uncharacterized protein involved in exopolysaccharide biosynthesis
MDSLDIARACVRRWYVFVPILVLAVGGGYTLASSRPASYQAAGTITLYYTKPATLPVAPGVVQLDPRAQNPLFTTGGVGLLITSIVADMQSREVQLLVAHQGHTSTFTVAEDRNNNNLIGVAVTGSDPRDVFATAAATMALTDQRLVALQTRAKAPTDSQYRIFTISPATVVTEKLPSKVKLIGAVTGLGVLLGAAISLLLEGAANRRKRSLGLDSPEPFVDLLGDISALQTGSKSRSRQSGG